MRLRTIVAVLATAALSLGFTAAPAVAANDPTKLKADRTVTLNSDGTATMSASFTCPEGYDSFFITMSLVQNDAVVPAGGVPDSAFLAGSAWTPGIDQCTGKKQTVVATVVVTDARYIADNAWVPLPGAAFAPSTDVGALVDLQVYRGLEPLYSSYCSGDRKGSTCPDAPAEVRIR